MMQKLMVRRALSDSELEELIEVHFNTHYIKYLEMDEYGWIIVLIKLKGRATSQATTNGLFG